MSLIAHERPFADPWRDPVRRARLSIAKGDRLGLVAANGRGKSSLLRIMAGEEEATTGSVTRARGLVTAFAPQEYAEHLLPLSFYEAVRECAGRRGRGNRKLARRYSAR